MEVVIAGHDLSPTVKHEVPRGRFWSTESYYLYTLLWDPFILHRTGRAPVWHEDLPGGAAGRMTLLFVRSNTVADASLVGDVLKVGGRVVLQQPDPDLLAAIEAPMAPADAARPTLVSLRERWDLGRAASRDYYYPDQQPFLRLATGDAQALSRIGGNPDLVVSRCVAAWAGNVLEAISSYANMPGVLSQLMGDVGRLLAQVVGRFVQQPVGDEEMDRLNGAFELRRDFHALGYAYLTVYELARCLGREVEDLGAVEAQAIQASSALVAGDTAAAERQLTQAFQTLERINRRLQPVPAVFTDTLHGGELYPEIGYFEIDWPQHPADVLQTYLHWANTRSYRFNVDFGATTVRELALRFPDLFAELREAHERQVVEFVNGSCNQPYPPLHTLESQIRQFDVGVRVWRDVLGSPPRTYASQEFGFCPQLAAVLAQQGYHQAVIRVQNMGDAPTLRDEQIEWIAPSGDRLRSLPSHPHKSEQLNQYTYNNLHLKLYLHQRDGLGFAVFTCIGDVSYHRHMREELARVCHYAPVFGHFATLSGYFQATSDHPAPEHRLAMQAFHCDAGFLNLERWPIYTESTGNFNSHCARSLAATSLFAAAELIDAVALRRGAVPLACIDHDAHWEALGHYQGHGTYIVPNYPSGAFLGGIGSPRAHAAGRGEPNVAEYVGPFSPRLIKDVTGAMLASSEHDAAKLIQQRLGEMASSSGAEFMLYSFAPRRQRLVTLPDRAGRTIQTGESVLPTQDWGNDRLALVDLPSYGYATVASRERADAAPEAGDPVRMDEQVLENQALRAEFDLSSGGLRRLLCRKTGAELLAADSGVFYCPGSGPPRCVGVRRLSDGPLRGGVEMDIELPVEGCKPCRLRTRVWLDTLESVVDFETEVLEAPELRGNQWLNHLGVRFLLADVTAVETCHFNVLEPHDGKQLFSPNVLLARGRRANTVLLNEGNEFYLRQGAAISNILVVQNEPGRCFRYAIGAARANPLMQGRLWQQPVIAAPISPAEAPVAQEGPVGESSVSFISFDSPDVELLSCRWEDGALRVRLANTTGKAVQARLTAFLPILSAEQTALNGGNAATQAVEEGEVALSLRPWDIRQLRIRVDTETPMRRLVPRPARATV